MPITSTNYTDISYIEETVKGEIPDNSPTIFQILPTTSGAPTANITTAVSEVIRSDRQTDDLIPVDSDVTGDIEYELVYTPYKTILTELLRGTPDTVTEPGSSIVRNSNNLGKGYTFVKRALGIADPTYFYYNGSDIAQMSFNFETGSLITGTMTVLGRREQTATDASPLPGLTSQSFADIQPYSVMNSVQNVVIALGGGIPVTTKYSTMNLTINNNTTGAKAIGVLGNFDTADFTLDITADIALYFETITAYELFKNSGNFSVATTLTDALGNELVITLPWCKFETLDTPIDGKDNFLMMDGTFRALRDPTNDYMVEFKFTDAP